MTNCKNSKYVKIRIEFNNLLYFDLIVLTILLPKNRLVGFLCYK